MGVYGTESFLAVPRRKMFLAGSVVVRMEMGICSGNVLFTIQNIRDHPEFLTLINMDRSKWPRAAALVRMIPGLLLWGNWLTWLWRVLSVLILLVMLIFGLLLIFWDADDIALEMVDSPNIWTDGSREGKCTLLMGLRLQVRVWSVSEEYGDGRVDGCRHSVSVLGPLQSVPRAEFWGAIMALQAYYLCHLGIDSLSVSRTTGRLLDHGS